MYGSEGYNKYIVDVFKLQMLCMSTMMALLTKVAIVEL